MLSRFQGRWPYLLVVIVTLSLDRWTKSVIHTHLNLNQSISVIDGLFDITYIRNTGVAFGIFNTFGSPAKSLILSLLAVAAAALVIVYSLRNPARNWLLQGALSLILAGALGNLYDRLKYHYVIDFLEFYVRNYHWPAFNVADSAISTGVILLAFEILRHEAPDRA